MKNSGPVDNESLSSRLRWFLYLTVFLNGAAVLIVEILGAKILSPFFGTSHFVWTAQIGVTLVSLSVGYWFGGWMVDQSPDLKRLYLCTLGAGAYLALSIPFTAKVCYGCLGIPSLAVGSLLASMFLFFVPLTLLAVTGPFAIRAFTDSVAVLGGNVGRLYAVSTFGSVAGTVLIGYVLIPLLPNSTTMLVTAALLMLLALGWLFGLAPVKGGAAPVVVALVAGLVGFRGVQLDGRSPSEFWTEVERLNSNYGLMQVFETADGTRRYYLNDYLTQNTYDPATGQSTSLFTHMLHGLAKVYTRESKDVLCIGMGVGIVPMLFAREGSDVDVVEINDRIAGLARRHFGLEPERLNLTIGDGRHFVNSTDRQYDAVILDAFLGDSSPSHLMSREAFAQMRRVLKPDGVLVINSFGEFEAGKDYFTGSLDKTLKAVFGTVRIHATGNGNVFFVATAAEALQRHRSFDFDQAYPLLTSEIELCLESDKRVNPESGIVLSDDFNPVEVHDAVNREELRRRLAVEMRTM